MSWTYDPTSLATSPRDELRFILQDTQTTLQLLQDEELQYLLDKWMDRYDSVTYVAAVAAEVIARKFATLVSVSADGVNVSTEMLADNYRKMAAALREEYKDVQVGAIIDITNMMIGYDHDYSIKALRFGVGLHDNLWAGLQDYGGWTYDPFVFESSPEATGFFA